MNTLEKFNEAVAKVNTAKKELANLQAAVNGANQVYDLALAEAKTLRLKLDEELNAALPEAEPNPNVTVR